MCLVACADGGSVETCRDDVASINLYLAVSPNTAIHAATDAGTIVAAVTRYVTSINDDVATTALLSATDAGSAGTATSKNLAAMNNDPTTALVLMATNAGIGPAVACGIDDASVILLPVDGERCSAGHMHTLGDFECGPIAKDQVDHVARWHVNGLEGGISADHVHLMADAGEGDVVATPSADVVVGCGIDDFRRRLHGMGTAVPFPLDVFVADDPDAHLAAHIFKSNVVGAGEETVGSHVCLAVSFGEHTFGLQFDIDVGTALESVFRHTDLFPGSQVEVVIDIVLHHLLAPHLQLALIVEDATASLHAGVAADGVGTVEEEGRFSFSQYASVEWRPLVDAGTIVCCRVVGHLAV